ncbi:MAG: TIGR04013 family B12-binding domain/radical SAM domain-containing protein [Calditrichia bacterium]
MRVTRANQLTFPTLMNALERRQLDRHFRVVLLHSGDEVRDFVASRSEGMLLYSFMTPHLPEVFREVEQIRGTRSSRLLLLAGGPHSSGDPVSALKMGFDLAYSGAGETAFPQIVERYLQNGLPEGRWIVAAPPLQRLEESIPISRYFVTIPPLEITRGCFWNCRFCQTACSKPIHRDFESVEWFYGELKKRGYHRRVNFICPSVFEYGAESPAKLRIEKLERLVRFCKEGGTTYLELGIFPSEARPNTFRPEFVDIIRDYCSNRKITIGAQTGCNELLRQMKRGHTVEQVETACRLSRERGLKPLVDIIFGFPGETPDHRRKTLDFIHHLTRAYGARTQVHYFLPLTGTPLQNSSPAPLDYRSIDRLEAFQKGGICTGWWKEGIKLTRRIVELRDRINDREVEYDVLPPFAENPDGALATPGSKAVISE